jgi:glutamyl-tRNA reductase
MTVLVVGLSHRTAPVRLLERAAVSADEVAKFTADAASVEHVGEAVIVSTCNRIEAYAVVDRFHGGVAALSELLAARADVPLEELTPHLYVHYDDRAVQHLFSVVCGLDSMVVGEAQILGQVRTALREAQGQGTTGKVLGGLFQDALRVGKRAHTETGIDRAGSTLLASALAAATATLGPLADRRALLVGAGSMSGLAAAALRSAGVTDVTVVNRTPSRGDQLASRLAGRSRPLDELADALAEADLVVCSTGAVGHVVSVEMFAAAHERRGTSASRPQVVLDLALPRDVDPMAATLPGVTLIDLEQLGALLASGDAGVDVEAVRSIVAEEVAVHVAARAVDQVEPTVIALRRRAADVVAAELARLDSRLPDLDPRIRAELVQAVRRTVDKLLHEPTVRIKEFAADGDAMAYAEALHALFDLTPAVVQAVERVDVVLPVALRESSGGAS